MRFNWTLSTHHFGKLHCLVGLSLLALPPAGADPGRPLFTDSVVVVRSARSTHWLVRESTNFRIYSPLESSACERLPAICETLRDQLQATWLGNPGAEWSPKCDVVVHRTVAGYSAALGRGSDRSSGCATLEIEPGRVLKRRIDLRLDATDCIACALPHELTHVIVAERFTRRRIPLWADEGIAILAEPQEKQQRRRAALRHSLASKPALSIQELTTASDYPARDRRDVFLGECACLVSYLIELDSPAKFLEFVDSSVDIGFERALTTHYGLGDSKALEARWRPTLFEARDMAELLASRIAKITADDQN